MHYLSQLYVYLSKYPICPEAIFLFYLYPGMESIQCPTHYHGNIFVSLFMIFLPDQFTLEENPQYDSLVTFCAEF